MLLAHARRWFALGEVQPDGSTLRAHLQSVERRTGSKPPELDMPPLPIELTHVWHWFLALHHRRSYSERGPNPIGYADLLAWRELTAARPTPQDVDCMLALDGVFFNHSNERVTDDS